MIATTLPLLATLGLIIGVAVRHVAWRLAVDDPPRTRCSTCGASVRRSVSAVRPFTGRCTRCGGRQYPPPFVPELLSAAGFALSGWIGGGSLRVAALCWLVAFGLAAVLVDAAIQRLPDVLTWPCLALGYVSWAALAVGAAAGLCLAGLQAAAAIAARRTRLSDRFALGPSLFAGAILVLVAARR